MGIRILKTGNHFCLASRIHNRSGFTLLEVMVALTIIATVLVTVYKLHAQSLALALETRFNGIAPFLAQQKLADLTTGEAGFQETESGDFGEDLPDFRWRMVVAKMESGFQEKEDVGFARIDITIFDTEDEFHYTLQTYRLVPP